MSGERLLQYHGPSGWAALLSEEVTLAGPFFEYFALWRSEPYAFLFDSARQLPGIGRYSFMGAGPRLVYTARRSPNDRLADIELRYCDRPDVERRHADVFEDLERVLERERMPPELRAELALPFVGGAVGFFGYDTVRFIERLPEAAARGFDAPELCFMFVDQLLGHDHETATTTLLTTGRGDTPAAAQAQARTAHARALARLSDFAPRPSEPLPPLAADGGDDRVHERAYRAMVEAVREHIFAGDVFEVCTTYRIERGFDGDPWHLYRTLRAINPAPFACYLQLPELVLVSSSPERFLRASSDGRVETRPIKGTRPRGRTPQEDSRLRAELLGSEKDRAENIMIVDLARNDLGRVCEVDSIHVPQLMAIEEHPSVFQLVSTVRGQLAAGSSALQLLRACFPPGSMTGAPKIEAMKIIEALESSPRGLYSGCLGYFDCGGGMDFSVVIRSFLLQQGRCSIGVGGAVVADSDPGAEYEESRAKAHALLQALAASRSAGR